MAATDLLKNGLADITGTVEKAIVMICDESLEDDIHKKDSVKTKTSSAASSGLGGLAGLVADGAISKASDAAQNAVEKKVKDAAKEYADLEGIKTGSLMNDAINYNREFTVQFNPSTMQISARKYSEKDLTKGDATQNNNNINMASPYPDIVFSVTLLFERVVAEEAFLEDTRFKSLSTLGRSVVREGFNAITGGFETVQNMVEGFVGAIRNKRTRRICFAWNKMRYEGILNGVNTKYTMFDLYGRPVRGEVRLVIRLSDMQINDIDMGYWEDAYDKAFGFDPVTEGAYGKLKNAASAIGSAANMVTNAAMQTANAVSQITGMVGGLTDQIYTSLFGDEIKEEKQEEFKDTYDEKKKKDDEAHEEQLKENERKAKRERNFVSGQTNTKSVSIKEEKRDEERKTDTEIDKDNTKGNGNTGGTGNTDNDDEDKKDKSINSLLDSDDNSGIPILEEETDTDTEDEALEDGIIMGV